MVTQADFKFEVPSDTPLERLDAFLARRLPEFLNQDNPDDADHFSRSYAASLIRKGFVQVDGNLQKPSYRVRPFQQISGFLPPPEPVDIVAEPIPLDIRYQDDHLIVINKPAGLVVHPAPGHTSGTLVNALLFHCPTLSGIGGEQRPGIVHRLDKDTSGLLVVAKNSQAHHELSKQFKARTIKKQYLALVHGLPEKASGKIDLPLGRHPVERKKMSTKSHSSRDALTIWTVKERFPGVTLLQVDLKTGRTHQIRVHCQAMGHPIVGDPVYGPRRAQKGAARHQNELQNVLKTARRQLLHAANLSFIHPATGKPVVLNAPLPEDMISILEELRSIR